MRFHLFAESHKEIPFRSSKGQDRVYLLGAEHQGGAINREAIAISPGRRARLEFHANRAVSRY